MGYPKDRHTLPLDALQAGSGIPNHNKHNFQKDVVGIDEAQFFDSGLIDVCNQLANNGIRVIIAGLDMDFKGNPFGPMPQLCAIADEVSKVHAICVKCGQLASFSHRTVKNEKQVLLGETAEYEPLCRECYLRARGEDEQKV